jgi:hypothetical protein
VFERVAPHTLVWRLFPNGGCIAAVALPLEEADRIAARGWVKISGYRARIADRSPDEVYNAVFRIIFDEPYPEPHQ